jgi:PAS domain S-box-containing protein
MKKHFINKTNIFLIILFISMNLFVYFVTQTNVKQRIDSSMKNHINKLQTHYEIFISNQIKDADNIHNVTVKFDNITEILDKAWHTRNKEYRDKLRTELYKFLESKYPLFKEKGVLQYQFVFPDNHVFLRMHKPDKYGDDLSDIRLDFVKANNTQTIVRGFSKGRTAHGLRNVYPLFNSKKEHIGVMEVSFPSEILQKNLNEISKIHSHFLVKKDIFDVKQWKRNDMILKYQTSPEHKDYLLTISKEHNKLMPVPNLKKRIKNLEKKIDANIKSGGKFALLSELNGKNYVIAFYPIKNAVNNNTVAYLVSYEEDLFINRTISDSLLINLISFILLSILTYFIYIIINHKNNLESIVKSYDKNVIFSTTDLRGIITHVSDAFCNISGYTSEELIGKNHNIVRHPDMPKEAFKYLWEELKKERSVRLEVKNKKKNGDYYWVEAEFEPEYKNGEHIGYSAVRQDITHMKDIEAIQKEIIFTMGSIGESRSKETGNHVRRVAEYSKTLALLYGMSEEEAEMLRQASPMHDIGKVAIPDSILNKPGPLTPAEIQIMQTHSIKGHEMLKVSNRPLLNAASIVALEHHEKWNGKGYPNRKKGEQIHIYGRITAIADVFDALGSDRCYKEAWADEKIFNLFRKERGEQFDPELVDIFFANINEFLKIRERFKDS